MQKEFKKKKRKNEILIVEVTGITGARFSSRPWLKSMYKVSKCTENFLPNKITSWNSSHHEFNRYKVLASLPLSADFEPISRTSDHRSFYSLASKKERAINRSAFQKLGGRERKMEKRRGEARATKKIWYNRQSVRYIVRRSRLRDFAICGRPFNTNRDRTEDNDFHGKLASGLLRKRNPCVK